MLWIYVLVLCASKTFINCQETTPAPGGSLVPDLAALTGGGAIPTDTSGSSANLLSDSRGGDIPPSSGTRVSDLVSGTVSSSGSGVPDLTDILGPSPPSAGMGTAEGGSTGFVRNAEPRPRVDTTIASSASIEPLGTGPPLSGPSGIGPGLGGVGPGSGLDFRAGGRRFESTGLGAGPGFAGGSMAGGGSMGSGIISGGRRDTGLTGRRVGGTDPRVSAGGEMSRMGMGAGRPTMYDPLVGGRPMGPGMGGSPAGSGLLMARGTRPVAGGTSVAGGGTLPSAGAGRGPALGRGPTLGVGAPGGMRDRVPGGVGGSFRGFGPAPFGSLPPPGTTLDALGRPLTIDPITGYPLPGPMFDRAPYPGPGLMPMGDGFRSPMSPRGMRPGAGTASGMTPAGSGAGMAAGFGPGGGTGMPRAGMGAGGGMGMTRPGSGAGGGIGMTRPGSGVGGGMGMSRSGSEVGMASGEGMGMSRPGSGTGMASGDGMGMSRPGSGVGMATGSGMGMSRPGSGVGMASGGGLGMSRPGSGADITSSGGFGMPRAGGGAGMASDGGRGMAGPGSSGAGFSPAGAGFPPIGTGAGLSPGAPGFGLAGGGAGMGAGRERFGGFRMGPGVPPVGGGAGDRFGAGGRPGMGFDPAFRGFHAGAGAMPPAGLDRAMVPGGPAGMGPVPGMRYMDGRLPGGGAAMAGGNTTSGMAGPGAGTGAGRMPVGGGAAGGMSMGGGVAGPGFARGGAGSMDPRGLPPPYPYSSGAYPYTLPSSTYLPGSGYGVPLGGPIYGYRPGKHSH